MSSSNVKEIKIAHSPDSDDAFMFYGLATNKIRVPGLKFTHVLCDIETLNKKALDEAYYDVTAISFHAYPYLQDRYALMPSGGSVGEGYGPMIVSPKAYSIEEVKKPWSLQVSSRSSTFSPRANAAAYVPGTT